MPIIQLNLTPSRRDLRWFAGLWWPSMCAAIGLMLTRKFHLPAAAVWIWAAAGLIPVMGVIAPSFIRPFYVTLMLLTYPIGWCVSHVLLAAVYFLVVTPAGIVVRLFHDPMTREFNRTKNTYWTARQAAAPGFTNQRAGSDLWYFLRQSRKWWLTPIVIVMFLFGLLVVLAGTGAAPFIYTLF